MKGVVETIKIDAEFKALIPQLTSDEYAQLEATFWRMVAVTR